MILCKYAKLDRAVYESHLDVLKIFSMAIRRKAINVNYSNGYNRHILLFMSQPLSLGLQSECEYFCIDSPVDPDEFLTLMNSSLPEGIRLLSAVYVKENPNIAALMRAADYEAEFLPAGFSSEKLQNFMLADKIPMEIVTKGEMKIKDIKPLIYDVKTDRNTLKFRIACGNINLKADKFVDFLCNNLGFKTIGFITKKHLYTEQNSVLIDIDDYLKIGIK